MKTHNTYDELNFVSKLGTHQELNLEPVQKLLRGYIAAAKRRENWGNIDKELVIEHAEKRLAKINGGVI